MIRKIVALITFIQAITLGFAQAEVSLTYSSMGKQHFSIAVPDNWRVNVGSDDDLSKISENESKPSRIISAMPNSGMPLWFGMWVPSDLERINEAEGYMESLGLNLLTDISIMDTELDSLNLMDTYSVRGTGKKDGLTMDFRTVFIQLSPKSVAIALYIGPAMATSQHGDELVQMINSLQSVTESAE